MTKLFLDTNIVIDLLERREPYCYDAVRLFTMAFNKNVSLFVSPMNLCDGFVPFAETWERRSKDLTSEFAVSYKCDNVK